jgi:hypothetical protein
MKQFAITIICLLVVLTSSQCEKVTPTGHLKVAVTYPEAVVIPDQQTYFIQVPADGAEVRLYDKDAICLGYKDAMLNLVKNDGQYETSLYAQRTNEKGEVLFENIPTGEYFLIVYARSLYKYTEKYIEVKGVDTLKLSKDFTPAAQFTNDLEPWDYEMPEN